MGKISWTCFLICNFHCLLAKIGAVTRNELHDIFEATTIREARALRDYSSITCPTGQEIVFGRKYHVGEGGSTCLRQRIGHCTPGASTCAMEVAQCFENDVSDDYSGVLSMCGSNSIPGAVAVSTVTVQSLSPVSLSCPAGTKSLFGFTHVYSRDVDLNDATGACRRSETKPCSIFQQSCSVSPCTSGSDPVVEIQMLCIPDADATTLQPDLYIESTWSDMNSAKTATCASGYSVLFGVTISAFGRFEYGEIRDTKIQLANDICSYDSGTSASCTIPAKTFSGSAGTGLVAVLCIKDRSVPTPLPTSPPMQTPTSPPTSPPVQTPTSPPAPAPTIETDTPITSPSPNASSPPTSADGSSPTSSPTENSTSDDRTFSMTPMFIGVGAGASITLLVVGLLLRKTKRDSARDDNPNQLYPQATKLGSWSSFGSQPVAAKLSTGSSQLLYAKHVPSLNSQLQAATRLQSHGGTSSFSSESFGGSQVSKHSISRPKSFIDC